MDTKNQNRPIFFYGKYINTKKILKSTRNASLKETAVNFVELDTACPLDLKSLSRTADEWKSAEYAKMIYIQAFSTSIERLNKDLHKFYVLTTQTKNFEKPDSKKIKGLMKISLKDKDCVILDYLQVKPEKQENGSKYRHVGKSLVSALRELFPNLPIVLTATKSSAGFYKKIGLKQTGKQSGQFTLPVGQDVR